MAEENLEIKTRSKRSWVWQEHFVQLTNSADQARCTHCPVDATDSVFSWVKGTSSMTNHLGRTHQIFKPLKPGEELESPQKKMKSSFKDEKLLESKLYV